MLKVLIAEDSVMLGELFEDFLTLVHYNVVGVAQTVGTAVALANLHQPDLAIIDFRLGNGEFGTQIPPLLRQKPGVLYLSGEPLSRKLSRADGEGFVQKPISLDDLDAALRAVWAIRSCGSIGSQAAPRGLHILPAPPEGDRQVA